MSVSLISPLLVAPPFMLTEVLVILDSDLGGIVALRPRLAGRVDTAIAFRGNVALASALAGSVDLEQALGGRLSLANSEEGSVDL
jgi:hypothetical protein